jgi:nucleoside 2-deoxyribosyltransferase
MNKESKICLIGDIFVDVTKNANRGTKLRFGGIVHSARTLWALNIPYDVGYFAPAYLDKQVVNYLTHHGCLNAFKIGDISGTPNVMLIQEEKEIGDQGYEYILRDAFELQYLVDGMSKAAQGPYENYLLISGNYDIVEVVGNLKGNIHIDVANNIKTIDVLKSITTCLSTIFVSSSSDIFKNHFNDDFMKFVGEFEGLTSELVLKENRGGSRSYNYLSKKLYLAHSQPRNIAHSVGVGDAFDAAYVSGLFSEQIEKNVFSSWIAAEYAVTSFPDDFKLGVSRVLKSDIKDLINLPGISLPWEKRRPFNIYIAGPDFSFVDTHYIEIIDSALRYHNFSPRRPIKENGQMEEHATTARKRELVAKDLQLLEECFLVVAVILYDDPGTLIEIGYARAKGVPTIVYDPYSIARNCMLTELPDLLTADLDEVVTEVFIQSAKIWGNGK